MKIEKFISLNFNTYMYMWHSLFKDIRKYKKMIFEDDFKMMK